MDLKEKREKDTLDGHRVFERKTVTIKVSSLLDDESMYYNPYKESVAFESIGSDRIISKNYVI